MRIHSKILIHWTGGKDIEKAKPPDKPKLYVERLEDYIQHGLYAKRSSESSLRKMKVKNLIRLCFTEIRLSQSKTHAKRYGKLGVGFSRDFILKKGGRPVIYVPYQPIKGYCILEESIKSLYKKNKNNPELKRYAKYILAHVKRMDNGNTEDYFEEMEWRLVWDESSTTFTKGQNADEYRLKFTGKDIKIIIFPNKTTQELALKNDIIKEQISRYTPILVNLKDSMNF
jgi:hypothetical protein